jgi:hypothetical protein
VSRNRRRCCCETKSAPTEHPPFISFFLFFFPCRFAGRSAVLPGAIPTQLVVIAPPTIKKERGRMRSRRSERRTGIGKAIGVDIYIYIYISLSFSLSPPRERDSERDAVRRAAPHHFDRLFPSRDSPRRTVTAGSRAGKGRAIRPVRNVHTVLTHAKQQEQRNHDACPGSRSRQIRNGHNCALTTPRRRSRREHFYTRARFYLQARERAKETDDDERQRTRIETTTNPLEGTRDTAAANPRSTRYVVRLSARGRHVSGRNAP